jgi:hypothetical protein
MPEIKLKMKEKVAPSKVVLGLQGQTLFTLIANIDAVSDDSCDVKLDFEVIQRDGDDDKRTYR